MKATPSLASAAVALLFLAAQASHPAHAAAGAEARIYNLTFTLQDLTPLDGIAPTFSFVNDPDVNRFRTELTVNVANTLLATNDAAINADFSFIATLDLDRSVVANQAIASTTATSARAWALSEAKGTAAAFASAESNLLFSGDFGLQLSPNSAITISADATVTAFDNGAAGAQGFAFEFARAESFLRIRGSDPGDGSGPQDSLSLRLAETVVDALGETVDSSGPLSVTFTNLSADPKFGYLSVRSTVGAYGVTPVPEPATWALGLGGLAALAWRVRRADQRRGALSLVR